MKAKPENKSERIRQYLKRRPQATGVEISKRLGVPKSLVYVVKNKLAKKAQRPEVVQEEAPNVVLEYKNGAWSDIMAEVDKLDKPVEASAHQVGGSHYRENAIQPWDYITQNKLGYLEGNIVKYVSRWKNKGGVEDLRKARHYLDKLIEISI